MKLKVKNLIFSIKTLWQALRQSISSKLGALTLSLLLKVPPRKLEP